MQGQRHTLADGRFSLVIPEGMEPLSDELITKKYPSAPPAKPPQTVFSTPETTVNVAISVTENNMPEEQIAQFIELMADVFSQGGEVLRSGTTEHEGRTLGEIVCITPAADTDIYNHMSVFAVDGKQMIVAFNCTVELREQWEQKGEAIIRSLRFAE